MRQGCLTVINAVKRSAGVLYFTRSDPLRSHLRRNFIGNLRDSFLPPVRIGIIEIIRRQEPGNINILRLRESASEAFGKSLVILVRIAVLRCDKGIFIGYHRQVCLCSGIPEIRVIHIPETPCGMVNRFAVGREVQL